MIDDFVARDVVILCNCRVGGEQRITASRVDRLYCTNGINAMKPVMSIADATATAIKA